MSGFIVEILSTTMPILVLGLGLRCFPSTRRPVTAAVIPAFLVFGIANGAPHWVKDFLGIYADVNVPHATFAALLSFNYFEWRDRSGLTGPPLAPQSRRVVVGVLFVAVGLGAALVLVQFLRERAAHNLSALINPADSGVDGAIVGPRANESGDLPSPLVPDDPLVPDGITLDDDPLVPDGVTLDAVTMGPTRVKYRGKVIEFPAGVSPDRMSEALRTMELPSRSRTTSGPLKRPHPH